MLEAVARGLSNRDIGRQLWISEQTVKFHLRNVYRKLGISKVEPKRLGMPTAWASSHRSPSKPRSRPSFGPGRS